MLILDLVPNGDGDLFALYEDGHYIHVFEITPEEAEEIVESGLTTWDELSSGKMII